MFAEVDFTDLAPYSVIYQISVKSGRCFMFHVFKLICPYQTIKNLPHRGINDNLKTLQTSGVVSSYDDSCETA